MSQARLKEIVGQQFVDCFNTEMVKQEELRKYRGEVNTIEDLLAISESELDKYSYIHARDLQVMYNEINQLPNKQVNKSLDILIKYRKEYFSEEPSPTTCYFLGIVVGKYLDRIFEQIAADKHFSFFQRWKIKAQFNKKIYSDRQVDYIFFTPVTDPRFFTNVLGPDSSSGENKVNKKHGCNIL